MCGIAGFLDPRNQAGQEALSEIARRMAQAVEHRGPDDAGVWSDPEPGIALGHRRLSIVDLSQHGHQPMASKCGRYQVVYNGEIYNAADLRTELKEAGHQFAGHSDTEVLTEAVSRWGLLESLPRLRGMFALAVWDRRQQTLQLARDRLGIKPLYYGWCRGVFLFGSELSALRAHPRFDATIDRRALALYMRHNYIPGPYSIYQNTAKLVPGSCLTIDGERRRLTPYWSLEQKVEEGRRQPFTGDARQAADRLEQLLADSVADRLIADVPVGAFLSGGIDSSLMVAAMQKQSEGNVRTFTIGFREPEFDEAPHARRVAEHLGTEHVEHYVSIDDALQVIPRLSRIYDEPFADASQLPTCLLAEVARRDVKVCLSGDGGDELFGGYTRYWQTQAFWQRYARCPGPVRRLLATSLRLGAKPVPAPWSRKLLSFSELLAIPDAQSMYVRLQSVWPRPLEVARGATLPSTVLDDAPPFFADLTMQERWMYLDLLTYLPDDLLVKVDRASMAVGLEVRVPLLDHRLVEFAWSLPADVKMSAERPKALLKDVLARAVPAELFERPKQGFGVPVASWLRGPLRAWAEELLDPDHLEQHGLLNAPLVRRKWDEHQSGQFDWQFQLWGVLMFQDWWRTAGHG